MLFTLAFAIHDKSYYLSSLLESWLDNLSGNNLYEVIVVCDGCSDDSHEVAKRVLAKYSNLLSSSCVIDTPDIWEIRANNAALDLATPNSDLIAFIQDDNFEFDYSWDELVIQARARVEQPGAVALLAGCYFVPDGETYCRVETRTMHKGMFFDRVNTCDQYKPGLYEVDFVTRPFVVDTRQLRDYGGLGGPEFDVLCWDDVDLSLKLQRDGHTNLYLSLDVLNTAMGQTTAPGRMESSFERNRSIVLPRWANYLKWRDTGGVRQIAALNGAGLV